MILKYKEDGDRHCRAVEQDGRVAEITIDLVLQARAKMAENKVNGPEDSIVSEMIKQVPPKILSDRKMLPRPICGVGGSPSSWKNVRLVFLRKPGADPRKGIRRCRDIVLTSVMSKWYE